MVENTCQFCTKKFEVFKYRKDAKFCSYECYWKTPKTKPTWNQGLRGVFKHTKEARMKISEAGKGRKYSDETRKKMSELAQVRGFQKENQLKSLTPEAIAKRTGPNNSRWKGGHQNKLILNQKRRALKFNANGSHTLAEWEALKVRFGLMCLCCKLEEPEVVLTEDHIVPLAKGGTNDITNIQPLCKSCNSRKNTQMIDYTQLLANQNVT